MAAPIGRQRSRESNSVFVWTFGHVHDLPLYEDAIALNYTLSVRAVRQLTVRYALEAIGKLPIAADRLTPSARTAETLTANSGTRGDPTLDQTLDVLDARDLQGSRIRISTLPFPQFSNHNLLSRSVC